jgi:hypothetical protein
MKGTDVDDGLWPVRHQSCCRGWIVRDWTCVEPERCGSPADHRRWLRMRPDVGGRGRRCIACGRRGVWSRWCSHRRHGRYSDGTPRAHPGSAAHPGRAADTAARPAASAGAGGPLGCAGSRCGSGWGSAHDDGWRLRRQGRPDRSTGCGRSGEWSATSAWSRRIPLNTASSHPVRHDVGERQVRGLNTSALRSPSNDP